MVTRSICRSYNDVSSQFGFGGDFEGWRYASPEEIYSLSQQAPKYWWLIAHCLVVNVQQDLRLQLFNSNPANNAAHKSC